MMLGTLDKIIVYVQDMRRQVGFYVDVLGLPLLEPASRAEAETAYWVVLDTGPCRLCLHGGGAGQAGSDAAKLVFGVADVPAARAALEAAGAALSEPRSPAPGVLVCDGRDPEGNPFSIQSDAAPGGE